MLWSLAGWMNEQQRAAIEYLQAENAVLRENLGGGRILLKNDQRRRLAVPGKSLGRKRLAEIASLISPDTILAWHRRLIAAKHTYARNSAGRPTLSEELVRLVVRLAKENPTWGCDRIAGELKKLGHAVSDTSIENILKNNGIEPAPTRKDGTKWGEFLNAHWECLAATDFTCVDVWTPTGLKTFYLLFVMELKTRRVQFLGSTTNPNEAWMLDAVERTTAEDGVLGGEGHPTILIMDRDSKFTEKFKQELKAQKVKPHVLSPRSPNLNAYMERFMLTFKSELVRRMIFFGKGSLDYATEQFLEHYHEERPHQGFDNELIVQFAKLPDAKAEIETTERLGGLLKSYRRAG